MLATLLRYLEGEGIPSAGMLQKALPRLAKGYARPRVHLTDRDVEAVCRHHARIVMEKMNRDGAPAAWARPGGHPLSPMSRLWMNDAFRLLFYLCRRRGELLRMRAKDVDLDRRLLYVRQTKTEIDFWAPIPPPALQILEEITRSKKPEDRLFPPITPDRVTRVFQLSLARAVANGDIAAEKAALALKDLRRSGRVHHQRHGMLPHEVQLLLGHSSIQTTEASYPAHDAERVRNRFEEAYRTMVRDGRPGDD